MMSVLVNFLLELLERIEIKILKLPKILTVFFQTIVSIAIQSQSTTLSRCAYNLQLSSLNAKHTE
jgi:hypothetical protein